MRFCDINTTGKTEIVEKRGCAFSFKVYTNCVDKNRQQTKIQSLMESVKRSHDKIKILAIL